MLSAPDANFTYDEEGNRATFEDNAHGLRHLYEWDHRNRLVSVTYVDRDFEITQQKIVYTYDAFDRRISKAVDTDGDGDFDTKEYYLWDDGAGNVLMDFMDADGDGVGSAVLAKRYLHGDAVDQIFAQENVAEGINDADRVLWFAQDNLNSVRDVIDNEGNVINRIDYDAFGNILSVTDPSQSDIETDLATRFLFTGQEWDADLGLYYYKARLYDPLTGQFISRDPMGFDAGDANLYRWRHERHRSCHPLTASAIIGTTPINRYGPPSRPSTCYASSGPTRPDSTPAGTTPLTGSRDHVRTHF